MKLLITHQYMIMIICKCCRVLAQMSLGNMYLVEANILVFLIIFPIMNEILIGINNHIPRLKKQKKGREPPICSKESMYRIPDTKICFKKNEYSSRIPMGE